MSALTIERKTPKLGQVAVPSFPCNIPYNLEASAKIFAGGLIGLNASGNAISAAAAGAVVIVGIAEVTVDNAGGAAGAKTVTPRQGVFQFANSSGADLISNANVGQVVYVVDDQTVALTSAGGSRIPAGIVYAVDAAGIGPAGVWVSVGPMENLGAIAFTAPSNPVRQARTVVVTNVANLAAFAGVTGGTPNDGVTCVQGDRVLLAGQSTASQNGVYTVGVVAGGVAPLTRATDWATGLVASGHRVTIGPEGTLFANSEWQVTTSSYTTAITVGTTNVSLFPRVLKGIATLVAGTVTITTALFSTTLSSIALTRAVANTTTATTGGYAAISPAAGVQGSFVIQAQVAAGTINNADVSTIYWTLTNF